MAQDWKRCFYYRMRRSVRSIALLLRINGICFPQSSRRNNQHGDDAIECVMQFLWKSKIYLNTERWNLKSKCQKYDAHLSSVWIARPAFGQCIICREMQQTKKKGRRKTIIYYRLTWKHNYSYSHTHSLTHSHEMHFVWIFSLFLIW